MKLIEFLNDEILKNFKIFLYEYYDKCLILRFLNKFDLCLFEVK